MVFDTLTVRGNGMITFRGLLALQADRDDELGAMARRHRRCRFTSHQAFTRHLLDCDATEAADYAASRVAFKLYRRRCALQGETPT